MPWIGKRRSCSFFLDACGTKESDVGTSLWRWQEEVEEEGSPSLRERDREFGGNDEAKWGEQVSSGRGREAVTGSEMDQDADAD